MARGPQVIAQPGGSVTVAYSATTASIQTAINANPGATTFWIEAGVRAQTVALVPKTGNTFVFEYGAILDGSGWSTSDGTQGAFRAHNENIDTVTIRNAEIRYMPHRGVHAYKDFSNNWTVEDCLIHHCKYGFHMPHGGILQRSVLHHCIGNELSTAENRGGAYLAYLSDGILIDDNEISYCGSEQKIVSSAGSTVSNNYYHHNYNDIWFDSDNESTTINDNTCEDTNGAAIWYEVSQTAAIYNNIIRRADQAIFLSTSKDNEVYNNTLEDCWRGLQVFLDTAAVGTGVIVADAANNNIHDNTVTVGTRAGSIASQFSSTAATATTLAPYMTTNTKNNLWIDNTYNVPTTDNGWWYWGATRKTFAEWQAIPQDSVGLTFPAGTPGTGGGTITTGGDVSVNDLVFSGYADSDAVFVSPSGTIRDQGITTRIGYNSGGDLTIGCSGIATLDDGRYCFSGTFFDVAPDYPGTYVQDSQWAVPPTSGNDKFNWRIVSNHVDKFYGIYNKTPVAFPNFIVAIQSIDPADGHQITNWEIGTFPSGNFEFGVSADESVAYFVNSGNVSKIVLSTLTISTFITGFTGLLRVLRNGNILLAGNTSIRIYSSAGALLYTHAVPNAASEATRQISEGLDDSSFFLMTVTTLHDPTTHYGNSVYEIGMTSGAVLNSFECPLMAPTGGPGITWVSGGPFDGLPVFEWDGPFTVVRAAIGDPPPLPPPPGIPPVPVLINSVPCCDAGNVPAPNPGPVPPTVVFIPTLQCTGGGGIPLAPLLTDSENWDT